MNLNEEKKLEVELKAEVAALSRGMGTNAPRSSRCKWMRQSRRLLPRKKAMFS